MNSKNDLWDIVFVDFFRALIVDYSLFPGTIVVIPAIYIMRVLLIKKKVNKKWFFKDYLYFYVLMVIVLCSIIIQGVLIIAKLLNR